MALNSDQLEAFFEVAKLKSFSRAANALAISQPALSQRVRKLEEELQATLFVRESRGVSLTDLGQRLLRYCRTQREMEAEFLAPQTQALNGTIRIAGFSSIMRSAVVPAIAPLVADHPHLHLDLVTRELHELPDLLRSAATDFVLTDKPIATDNVANLLVGVEDNILIEPARTRHKVPDLYFDHDLQDQTTFAFFRQQARAPSQIRRSFLDEIYAIIAAVENGWGRAVVPRHLVATNRHVRRVAGFSAVQTQVYLNYQAQPFYLPLHLAIRSALHSQLPVWLKAK